MELTARLRRLRYVWGWRLRYWYMDTRAGTRAQVAGFCLAVLVAVLQLVRVAVAALAPRATDAPAQAVYWWVVQLIVLIVAAAIAYALRPKPPQQQERKIDPPTVEEGTAFKDYFGTCWIEHDDSMLLAWKVVGRDPIRTKAGKK